MLCKIGRLAVNHYRVHMKKSLADDLKVRVNPEYDHDIDPDANDFAYWNPVSATNDLIKLANSALQITQAITDAMQDRMRLNIELRNIERDLETLERAVMVADPLTPTEAKSNKTISGALQRRFEDQGYADSVSELRSKRDKLEDRIDKLQELIDAGVLDEATHTFTGDHVFPNWTHAARMVGGVGQYSGAYNWQRIEG